MGSRGDLYSQPRAYIYYSDDKILELSQQIPEPRRGRLRGVGVTVVGTGGNVNWQQPEETVLQKLQRIWEHLDREQLVGSFDEPKQYFHGQLEFYYGIFDVVNPPVFFLAGSTDQTIIGLGGSTRHVRGHRDEEMRVSDNTPNVTMEPEVATLLYGASQVSPDSTPTEVVMGPGTTDRWPIYLAGMYTNWQFWKGRKSVFEVLARQEGRSHVSGPPLESPRNVLIGSPIFVALP